MPALTRLSLAMGRGPRGSRVKAGDIMEKIKIIDVKSVGYEGDIEDWNPFGEFCHIDEYIIFALDDRDENNQAMYI